jgi:hypothetical protein
MFANAGGSNTGSSLFGAKKNDDNKPAASSSGSAGLFGGKSSSEIGNIFGSSAPKPADKPQEDKKPEKAPSKPSGNLFGASNPKPASSIFGGGSKDDNKPASSSSGSSLFGKKDDSKQSALPGFDKKDEKPTEEKKGSLFGAKPAGGLFAAKPAEKDTSEAPGWSLGGAPSKPSSGSSLFGAKKDDDEEKPKNAGLDKEDSVKKSLFGSGGSSLFGKKDEKTEEKKDEKKEAPKASLTITPGSGAKSPFAAQKEANKSASGSLFGKPAAKPDEKKEPAAEGKDSKSLFGAPKKDDKPSPFGAKPDDKDKKEDSAKKPNLFGKTDSKEADAKKASPFGAKDASKPPLFGAKKSEGDKKAEEEKGKEGENKEQAAPVKPESVEVIKKATLEQSKKMALDTTALEDLFSSWYNQVDTHSERFKKHAKQLKKDELTLYDNIIMLESLSKYSEKVITDYGSGLTAMEDLAKQQEILMKSLDKIDEEIDDAIKKKTRGEHMYNSFRGYQTPEDSEIIDKGNYRQQMAAKAYVVNSTLDDIDGAVNGLGKVLTTNSDETASDEGSKDINIRLNQSYDVLKWIQDTACELNYQIEVLDRFIDDN